jgi:hypothetical protein
LPLAACKNFLPLAAGNFSSDTFPLLQAGLADYQGLHSNSSIAHRLCMWFKGAGLLNPAICLFCWDGSEQWHKKKSYACRSRKPNPNSKRQGGSWLIYNWRELVDSSNRMYCNNVIDTDNDSMADPTRKVLVFGTGRSLLSSALRAAPPQ